MIGRFAVRESDGVAFRAAGDETGAGAEGGAGAREAFERLTGSRLERAYRLATIVLGDPTDAEDAVHDAAVTAWRCWRDLREPARFDAWFDRIVVNTCRDRLRRARRQPVTFVDPAALPDRAGTDPEGGRTERDALDRALADLSPDHRVVLALRFVEDLTVPEIAARTGAREGTVKSRLHHALRALRAAYDAAARAEEVTP